MKAIVVPAPLAADQMHFVIADRQLAKLHDLTADLLNDLGKQG